MRKINLRAYYPFYQQDCFVELPDEIVEVMKPFEVDEQSHYRRMRLHKVYSLDCYEGEIRFCVLTPDEIYERKVTRQTLHTAIAQLPDKQAKRIYAHYFLGMTFSEIARAEGVHISSIRIGIDRGLQRLEYILKNSL